MVEVRLHGELAKDFGKVWHLDINSPAEAVKAIEANCAGFMRRIMDLSRKGMVFRVRTKDHDYSSEDVHLRVGSMKRVDIIPIIVGASAGVRFVVGAVLIAVGFFLPSPATPYLYSAGISLMLGSVVEWLTPIPKKSEQPGGLDSWSISGAASTVDQGYPVPVIYGEVLAGGYTVSASISASETVNTSAAAPTTSIGGEDHIVIRQTPEKRGQKITVVFSLGGSALETGQSIHTWTISGFGSAMAVRVPQNRFEPAIRFEVDVTPGAAAGTYIYQGTAQYTLLSLPINSRPNAVTIRPLTITVINP